VKRPVTAVLLALFIMATMLWRSGPVPIFGSRLTATAPRQVVLGMATPVAGVAAGGGTLLRAADGTLWRWNGGGAATPVAVSPHGLRLPGGWPVTVEGLRLGGRPRIVGILGAPSWIAPGGLAAVVYDSADGALWALHAGASHVLPLGVADRAAPDAVVWGASGGEVAYLSGEPPQLWLWRVGEYAERVGMADGLPLAVRGDSAVVMAVGGRLGVEWPRFGRALLVSMARPLIAAPDGGAALCTEDGRLYWIDADNGQGRALPVPRRALAAAAFGPDDRLALLQALGHGRVAVVTSGPRGGATRQNLPAGYALPARGLSLAWLAANRLAVTLDGPRGYATYAVAVRAS
jgi:hypothetical protein